MVHTINENLLLTENDKGAETYERNRAEYKNLSKKFVSGFSDFSKQFAHVYAVRLAELRKVLEKKVTAVWENVPILKLPELEGFEEDQCIVIGTLYKHQQWKPSILREFSDEIQLCLPTPKSNYCSEIDQPFLEDEMLRIKLTGNCVDIKHIITGVVCAVRGYKNEDSAFVVEDWCFPDCVPKTLVEPCKTKGKLILISGLDLANTYKTVATNLLMEWLCGLAGTIEAQKEGASIVRVIIAGNKIMRYVGHTEYFGLGNTVKGNAKAHVENEEKVNESTLSDDITVAIKNTDTFISEISKCCCVTIMPGQHDPANIMMPQKPFHPCLLPNCAKLQSCKSVSNPWVGKVGERIIMGSSGEPIVDILKVSGESNISPLEWLKKTLTWRHLCPTAPDTLPSHPYYENDLLIMKECPDIYFAGNMDEYETELWKGEENQIVRLICIPKFAISHTIVIVDLDTLETKSVSFGTG